MTSSRTRTSRRVVAFWLVAVSGGVALCHQLLWTRALLDVLGSSEAASARVLGAFFLGLSLGAALASRVAQRVERRWRALAIAELAIAALSVPALTLASWSDWIWPAVGPSGLQAAAGGWVKVAVSLIVVVPPAVAMGATLPLAIRAVARHRTDANRDGLWLYSVNTAGAVAGLLVLSGWLLHVLGLHASMAAALCLNCAIAAVALGFDWTERPTGVSPSTEQHPSPASAGADRPTGRAYWLAFLSGAGILATEVVVVHMLMLVTTMSFVAPTAILAAVIAVLALAAALTPLLLRWLGQERALIGVLSVGGALLAAAPLAYWHLVSQGAGGDGAGSLFAFVAGVAGLTVAFVGPGVFLVGTVFPMLIAGHREEGATSAATRVGRLLAVNGLGGLAGAELAHQVLLPAAGPYVSMAVIGGTYAVAGVALAAPGLRSPRKRGLLVPALCAVSIVVLGSSVLREIPTINQEMGFRLIAEKSGRHGALAVVEHPTMGRAMLVNNQYVLGSTAAAPDQARQTHLPLLLHDRPATVGVIGLATGVSAGAAVLHDPVEQVEILELSGAVIDAAREHFSQDNYGVNDHPKARIVEEDGRVYISAAEDRFDVVVGDLFLPWSSGVGRLYSVEHFRAVARALKTDGVFCQWLPMHQLTERQVDVILASITDVFPEVHLFRNSFHPDKPSMGIVAVKGRTLSWSTVAARAKESRTNQRLRDPTTRHGVGVALLYIGRVTADDHRDVPRNTLANLTLELDAARQRVTGDPRRIYLGGQRFVDYLHRRVRQGIDDDSVPRDVRRLSRLGFDLTNWEIAVRIGHAKANELGDGLRRRFPRDLRSDESADWSLWPGVRANATGQPL